MKRQHTSRAAGRRWVFRAATAIIGLCLSFVAVGCGGEPVEEKAVARPVKILTIGGLNSAGWREYPGTIRGAQTAEMA
ncbi:MAG: hypothetical protein V3U14_03675, partial [candidate division NC10 bacterium]